MFEVIIKIIIISFTLIAIYTGIRVLRGDEINSKFQKAILSSAAFLTIAFFTFIAFIVIFKIVPKLLIIAI